MEVQYSADPMFFEEPGAMSYCFDASKGDDLEIAATLHVYEDSMRLVLDYYNKGEGVPFKVKNEDMTTFKELTQAIELA